MSHLSRCALAGALSAMTVAAAACGADSPADARVRDSGAERAVRQVHQQWVERLAAGRTSACRLLTAEARLRMINEKQGACFYAVGRFAGGLDEEQQGALAQAGVRRVTVRGNRATIADRHLELAPVVASLLNGRSMVLRRVDGRWRIARDGWGL